MEQEDIWKLHKMADSQTCLRAFISLYFSLFSLRRKAKMFLTVMAAQEEEEDSHGNQKEEANVS